MVGYPRTGISSTAPATSKLDCSSRTKLCSQAAPEPGGLAELPQAANLWPNQRLNRGGDLKGHINMRRVVVTGMGIVSSIGNNTQEVLASLREAKSGIVRADKYAELGFRCQVHGAPRLDPEEVVDRRAMRFLGGGRVWNHVAMEQAIRDSGVEEGDISNERSGIVMGSGGPSCRAIIEAADTARSRGPKRVGPFAVPKAMSSIASATLATSLKVKGVTYSISSACAPSNHCIGNAAELIQWGKQDLVFAGGCEELDWSLSVLFDAMGAMSSKYNATPQKASRAYDRDRD